MIHPSDFTNQLIKNELGPLIEVPCSYFKDFFNYLWETKTMEVINPVNEALVMGIASGYYLSTGKIPIVAMQNSGFMNTLNALTSLNQIYKIPVFYLITWRGEGGEGCDAPEHDITGERLEDFLNTFKLPYEIINENYEEQIKRLADIAKDTKEPVVLVIKRDTFEKYSVSLKQSSNYLSRFEAIKIIKNSMEDNIFISTTGFPSRDSFAVRDSPDFYIVGSMGHAFSIALGVSPNTIKKVVILDGDGSALMHLGGLASFDSNKCKNIFYFVFDNESYESTGGQPSVSGNVNFLQLAKSFNFKNIYEVLSQDDLNKALEELKTINEAAFIYIKIKNESEHSAKKRVSDEYSCPQIKTRFMGNFANAKNN